MFFYRYQESLQLALCSQGVEDGGVGSGGVGNGGADCVDGGGPTNDRGGGAGVGDDGAPPLDGGGQREIIMPVYAREETSLDISPKVALLFVLLMCVMLVALYFLYQYLGECCSSTWVSAVPVPG